MGTRFGRRTSSGNYEYHDSQEELDASEWRESSNSRTCLFGLFGLVVGGVLTYVALQKTGMELPKWLRFILVIVGSGGLGYVLAKLANILWYIILSLVLLTVLWGIGLIIWKAV